MKPRTNRHTSGRVQSPTRANLTDTIAAGRRSGVPKPGATTEEDWEAHLARAEARYRDGEARLRDRPAGDGDPADPESRQRQLTRLGNAAGGAGLSLLMLGRRDEAAGWFERAAERYRESFRDAPPGSWGRPIGAMKALILAGDWRKAEDAARWGLEAGAAEADSPIGRYAAALALLVLDRPAEARRHADVVRTRDDFPNDVGDALAFLAAQDVAGYETAVESVLESFETRDEYLEDLPIADTVAVLQALAERRGMAAELSSPLLPA
jgi:tetratricopeptide (TPR) repeat protein